MNSQREKFEEAFKRPKFVELIDDEYRMVGDYTPETFMNFMEFCARWQGWQAATEQGVGEAFAYATHGAGLSPDADCGLIHADEVSEYNPDCVTPVYTHSPKPTGGGVPGEWVMAMQRVIDWFDACNEEQDLICPREEYARIKALLATQQPPEQE